MTMLPTRVTIAIVLIVISVVVEGFFIIRKFIGEREPEHWEMIMVFLINLGVLISVANYATTLLAVAERL